MKRFVLAACLVLGGFALVPTNSARAQVAVSVGTPFGGVYVGAPAYGYAPYYAPAIPAPGTFVYSSGYQGYMAPYVVSYPAYVPVPSVYPYPVYVYRRGWLGRPFVGFGWFR